MDPMSDNCYGWYPRDWYLEGKNHDSKGWTKIDQRSDETELEGKKKIKKFKNNIVSKSTFQIFRLTLTKESDSSTAPQLGLNEMDFIGETSLVPNPVKKKKICLTRVMSCNRSVSFIYVLIGFLSK